MSVDEYLERLEYPPDDPRHVIGEVSRVLAREMDRAPSAVIARELRFHLDSVAYPNEPAGFVDEIRARRAKRRVELLLNPPADGEGGK